MENLASIIHKFNTIKSDVLQKAGERDAIKSALETARTNSSVAKQKESRYAKSIEVLQNVSTIMKTKTIENIETLITKGLHDVLEETNLKFVIDYESKRNAIQAKYQIRDIASKTDYDIIDSFGGGIADVISILQRIIFVYQFNTSKILVMDESGKWISNDHQVKFGKFLSEISKQLGIQIIFISHKDNMTQEADKTIKVKIHNEASVIEVTGRQDV